MGYTPVGFGFGRPSRAISWAEPAPDDLGLLFVENPSQKARPGPQLLRHKSLKCVLAAMQDPRH